jgi:hypothetical protein
MWIEVKGGDSGLAFIDGDGIEFPFPAMQDEVAAPAVAEFEKMFRQS